MKRLLLTLTIFVTVLSCSRDEDKNYSALENFTGQWELQSRIINDASPESTSNEKFTFRDDGDIRDFKGLFTLESSDASNGTFSIVEQGNVMSFEASNGTTFSYEFILNTITLSLGTTNNNGDVVKEVWIKTSNYID
jgi:hypothetical protein